ncbi:Ankyrin-1 [Fusarium oxysporum f. sp. raphani]|uniref:Ankyrin-1 n=1 Tax=Fusarium oxysporum f. sp. raphani TaxID=96318 RepID=A0A8J5PQ40_FUSOX|nr:Ankyrin-1 [Fusarium oxysporum f. sp. raphani]
MPAKPRKSSEKWKSIRGDFFEYYIVQKHTLKETMAYLRDQKEFTASQKEYRRRLEEWGLHKNLPRYASQDIVRGNINGDVTRRRIRLSPKTAERRLVRNTRGSHLVLLPARNLSEIPWFCFEERNLCHLRALVETVIPQLPWITSLETPGHLLFPAEFSLISAKALLGTFFAIPNECKSHDLIFQVMQQLRSFMPQKPNPNNDHISIEPFFLLIHSCIYLSSNGLLLDQNMNGFLRWVCEIGAVSCLNDVIDELVNKLQGNPNATTEIFLFNLLRSAVDLELESLVHALLRKGVNPDQENWLPTPLQIAVHNRNLLIIQLLLEHKAKVNGTTKYISTPPIVIAVSMDHANLDIVDALIKYGSDVNCWCYRILRSTSQGLFIEWPVDGRTLLMEAVYRQNLEITELLLKKGANVHKVSTLHGSALQIAVRKGDIKMAQLLWDNGADLDWVEAVEDFVVNSVTQGIATFGLKYTNPHFLENEIWTSRYAVKSQALLMPLQTAAFQDNLDMVRFLLDSGVQANHERFDCVRVWNRISMLPVMQDNPEFRDELKDNFKAHSGVWLQASQSALHAAIENGNVEMAECLLLAGASVDDIDASGATALQVACGLSQIRVEQDYESDEDGSKECEFDEDESDEDEFALVKLLLEWKADINFPAGSSRGRTALQAAAQSANEHLVTFLLSRGADVNASAGHIDGMTALRAAAVTGKTGLVTQLIEAGAMSNQAIYHITLHAAVRKGLESEVDKLLTTSLHSSVKRAVLSSAILGGHPRMVRKILDHHVDPNEIMEGETALHTAVKADNREILEMLLGEGADPNNPGVRVTPLALAASMASTTLVEILLKAKADVYQPSYQFVDGGHEIKANALGWALCSWIRKLDQLLDPRAIDIVSLLLEHGADPNEPDSQHRYPIELVSTLMSSDLLAILLDKNVDVDAPCSVSPLGLAFTYWMSNKDIGMAKESEQITRKTIDMSKKHLDESILFGLAVKYTYFSWVKELLGQGLNVNSTCESRSALAWACWHRQFGLVKKLLDEGSYLLEPINSRDFRIGNGIECVSLLQIATTRAHFNILKLLLDHGAKDNRDGGLATALEIAARDGLLDISFLLLQYDDEPHTLKTRCIDAAKLAARGGHQTLAQKLREYIS